MEIKCSLNTFKKTDVTFIDSEKAYISRVADRPIAFETFQALKPYVKSVGVTDEFKRSSTPLMCQREKRRQASG